ncbi:hypothetical protein CC86DRAFT_425838 [Ophiobolus disseminans]|uniref:Uncharacterized protein n=1 Tax=Ophiobolus disseminans TaxID=1469910 RepID=A0A6A6ZN05_9PLEO|nr:hypothetical protein CC86DRAFT_425838 [Ophiobolus disseminans]
MLPVMAISAAAHNKHVRRGGKALGSYAGGLISSAGRSKEKSKDLEHDKEGKEVDLPPPPPSKDMDRPQDRNTLDVQRLPQGQQQPLSQEQFVDHDQYLQVPRQERPRAEQVRNMPLSAQQEQARGHSPNLQQPQPQYEPHQEPRVQPQNSLQQQSQGLWGPLQQPQLQHSAQNQHPAAQQNHPETLNHHQSPQAQSKDKAPKRNFWGSLGMKDKDGDKETKEEQKKREKEAKRQELEETKAREQATKNKSPSTSIFSMQRKKISPDAKVEAPHSLNRTSTSSHSSHAESTTSARQTNAASKPGGFNLLARKKSAAATPTPVTSLPVPTRQGEVQHQPASVEAPAQQSPGLPILGGKVPLGHSQAETVPPHAAPSVHSASSEEGEDESGTDEGEHASEGSEDGTDEGEEEDSSEEETSGDEDSSDEDSSNEDSSDEGT